MTDRGSARGSRDTKRQPTDWERAAAGRVENLRARLLDLNNSNRLLNFKFGERMNLQLVAQAFNLTNRANYGNNFGNSIASSTFTHPTGFFAPNATFIPRSIWGEFGVHFTF